MDYKRSHAPAQGAPSAGERDATALRRRYPGGMTQYETSGPAPDAPAVFDAIAQNLFTRPDVDMGPMFGSEGMRVRGKVFAFMGYRGSLVVKVPQARADELAREPGIERMVMRERPLREWVMAGPEVTDRWASLVEEAYAYLDEITP